MGKIFMYSRYTTYFILLIFVCIQHSNGLSCPPCGTVDIPKPECCESGYVHSGACGCSKVCANTWGDTCGGPWGKAGLCAPGFECVGDCGGKNCTGYQKSFQYGKCVFPGL